MLPPSITSYAQNFEDVLLWRALHDAEPKSYLDIGAQDPTQDSVSLAFYEAGWRGTHVEPTPFYAAKLREARPDETVIEAVVSLLPGPLEFHEFPHTGMSTGKADIARKHLDQGFAAQTILVPTVRLDNLLEQTREIPWMKIDVEGMEADVLSSWGNSAVRPWVLIIEATVPNSQVRSDGQWQELVLSRGYQEIYFDGLSRYFVHEARSDLADRLSTPPNVFDGFQTTLRHFSTAAVSQSHADLTGQLESKALSLSEQLQASETARELAQQAQLQAEALVSSLDAELATVRRERDTANEGLAVAERLKQALSILEDQLGDNRTEVAILREREGEHLKRADALLRDQQEIEGILRRERDSLSKIEQQHSDLSSRLALANRIIRTALAEPSGRWQRFGQTLGLAGEDRARQALKSWEPYSSDSAPNGWSRSGQLRRSRRGGSPCHEVTLAELLSWQDTDRGLHDEDFVRQAYKLLLNRDPEPAGLRHYTSQLHHGSSRIRVLADLAGSAEGRRINANLPGLRRAILRQRMIDLLLLRRIRAGQ